MAKIRMFRGLPGSGKTTEAREIVRKDGNAGRINRDDLRAMLFNGVWTGKREGIVIEVEKAIASVLLKNQYVALIDDTNLLDKHWDLWRGFATALGVEISQTTMTTSREECIARDKNRPNPVGEVVINRMALNAGWIKFDEKPIALVDIDGTLADGAHREHYLHQEGGKKDWDGYYSKLIYDEPIRHIVEWVKELSKDHTILIVSGRPDTYQKDTLDWLRFGAKVPFDYAFMRAGNDKREDSIIKSEILDKLPFGQIDLVLDDRPRVVRMWRERGLKVIPVKGACEDF